MPWLMSLSMAYRRHGSLLGHREQTQTAVLNGPPCSGNHHAWGNSWQRASSRQLGMGVKVRKVGVLSGGFRSGYQTFFQVS